MSWLPVSARNVGIVFQSYALFPNLTAGRNIGYGLRGRRRDRGPIRKRIEELLKLVGLHGLAEKYPAQLSGGQEQRVALARAMALSPDLLLLDEPLSALDAQVRITLRSELRQLQRRLGVTTLMVTHDQEEALTMADRILVMDQGVIVQEGTPHEIYQKPVTPFVAAFIGSMNFLHDAVTESADTYRADLLHLRVRNGGGANPPGSRVTIAIRPEDVRLGKTEDAEVNTFAGRILGLEFRGPLSRVTVRLAGGRRGAAPVAGGSPQRGRLAPGLPPRGGSSCSSAGGPHPGVSLVTPTPAGDAAVARSATSLRRLWEGADLDRWPCNTLTIASCGWLGVFVLLPLFTLLSKSLTDSAGAYVGLANFLAETLFTFPQASWSCPWRSG